MSYTAPTMSTGEPDATESGQVRFGGGPSEKALPWQGPRWRPTRPARRVRREAARKRTAPAAPRRAADPTYSFDAWGRAARTGAALLWRAPTGLGLPVVKVLPDGTYLAVLVNPAIRGPRRERILAAASAGAELDPDDAQLVRVVEYDVPDRDE